MNPEDREDICIIVESVLDAYFTRQLIEKIITDIDAGLKDNWKILKLMRGGRHEKRTEETA